MKELSPEAQFQIEKRKLTLLLENTPAAVVGNFINSGLLVTWLWSCTPHSLCLLWLGTVYTVNLIRLLLTGREVKAAAEAGGLQAIEQIQSRQLWIVGLSALLWAFAATALFPNDNAHVGLLAFVVAGTTAGALTSYSVSFDHVATFLLIVLVPFTVRLIFAGDTVGLAMATMTALYCVMLLLTAKRSGRYMHQAFALEQEKEGLIEQLRNQFQSLKRVNLELQNTRAQLIKTVQMATLGEIAGNLAHEVNNPMTIVLGNFERLTKQVGAAGQAAPAHKFMEAISSALSRIRQTVSSFLVFSNDNLISGNTNEVVLQRVCETALQVYLSRYRNERIRVITNIPGEESKIIGNEALLSQMIFLLMQNSFDSLYDLTAVDGWIQISVATNFPRVIVTISDSGSADRSDTLSRSDEVTVRPGRQLDLVMAKRIAEKHGGELVWLKHLPHFTLQISLPLAGQRLAAA